MFIRRRSKTLAPAHPNLGIEADYRKRLYALIAAMDNSLLYWLRARWRSNPPIMAQDALPGTDLRREMRALSRQWQSNFDEAAPKLAAYFATAASERTNGALERILDEAGFSVEFKMTRTAREVYNALIAENVGLIKSIASQHLTQVEGMVMRSVIEGRKLDDLAKGLEEQFGVTKRRAALIARDQNNKATAIITRVRQQELGITEAIWMHSGGGAHPRPTHVANDGQRFVIAEGWYDPAERKRIWPGMLINCRCISRSVIPGL